MPENKIFIFSVNNYYCLNKLDKDDEGSGDGTHKNERKRSDHKSDNFTSNLKRHGSQASISSHKANSCCVNLNKNLQIMLATKLKENFIIENYLRVVGEAAEKEHSYKQLTHQILQKQAEYDELVKQSDYHKSIKQKYDDTNIDPYDRL